MGKNAKLRQDRKTFKQMVGLYIERSWSSDSHAVYLGMGVDGDIKQALISAHSEISGAWDALQKCKQALAKCSFLPGMSSDEIRQVFLAKLIATEGDYASDDYEYQITPDGIKVIREPVAKRYKVKAFYAGEQPSSAYGDPEEGCFFAITDNNDAKIFSVKGADRTPVFTTYVTAAYIADYLNSNNLEELTQEEIAPLWAAANKLQGKL